MVDVPLLDELALVMAIAVLVTVLLARLRLPTVAGLLAAGALMGPFGLGLVTSVDAIEVLAEVGVVLLLFTIGLEFSAARLRTLLRTVAVGGLLQVTATVVVAVAAALALGRDVKQGVFYGFVFAMSSTAIVLRALSERGELDAPHGRFVVGTLIFQDLCVIPMVLVVPMLGAASATGAAIGGIGLALLKALAVVGATIGVARLAVPRLLDRVDAARSREVFLMAILGLCIGTAWLTALAGLSLALGALLAGMVVADTQYGHRAMGDILPLRDAFVSLFFVSLGMLLDVRQLVAQPLMVAALAAGFVVVKGALATLAALAVRLPARVAWLAGVGLAQFGEFGFVLTRLGQRNGAIDAEAAAPLLAAGILSMFLAPLLARAAPHVTAGERLLAPLERAAGVRTLEAANAEASAWHDHVLVVGFGLAGQVAARSLADQRIRFAVLDLNADNVRKGCAAGLPVYYADATGRDALLRARVDKARLVVLLTNDPKAVQRIVDTVKRLAPEVPVLVRTRYQAERAGLEALGARDVVAEEIEGAVEVVARMLRWLEAPRSTIDAQVRQIRSQTATSARSPTVPRPLLGQAGGLAEVKVECVEVRPGAEADGQSPASLQLRRTTGALVVGVRRGRQLLEEPDPTAVFAAGDRVFLVGPETAIARAAALFEAPPRTQGSSRTLTT